MSVFFFVYFGRGRLHDHDTLLMGWAWQPNSRRRRVQHERRFFALCFKPSCERLPCILQGTSFSQQNRWEMTVLWCDGCCGCTRNLRQHVQARSDKYFCHNLSVFVIFYVGLYSRFALRALALFTLYFHTSHYELVQPAIGAEEKPFLLRSKSKS